MLSKEKSIIGSKNIAMLTVRPVKFKTTSSRTPKKSKNLAV